jgi:hypothetical protein
MYLRNFVHGMIAFLVVVLLINCNGAKVKNDRKRYDSLFLGFSLGMEKKAFYDLCWEYNKMGLFTHGPTNQSVEYLLTKEAKSNVIMRFYPTFENDKVYEMPVTFTYEAWAPWNRQLQSDSLLTDMIKIFKKWYGDDFQVLNQKAMGKIFARIDGKRRINLFVKDDQFVQAVFTDLQVEEELKGKGRIKE